MEKYQMTRDEQLIRAALEMVVSRMNPDQYRREGADVMRAACIHAVNATASPIVGTPYSAGGRAFSDAIRAIDVDDVLARLPPAHAVARLAEAITPAPQPEVATPTAQEAVLREIIDWCHLQPGNCPNWMDRARQAVGDFEGDPGLPPQPSQR